MISEMNHSNGQAVVHARIRGLMTLADQQALEAVAKQIIDAGGQARLLVVLEDFNGWEKNEKWGEDLDFQFAYGHGVARIAIVADPRWKEQALLYVGQGFRETSIGFFAPEALEEAMRWVVAPSRSRD